MLGKCTVIQPHSPTTKISCGGMTPFLWGYLPLETPFLWGSDPIFVGE